MDCEDSIFVPRSCNWTTVFKDHRRLRLSLDTVKDQPSGVCKEQ